MIICPDLRSNIRFASSGKSVCFTVLSNSSICTLDPVRVFYVISLYAWNTTHITFGLNYQTFQRHSVNYVELSRFLTHCDSITNSYITIFDGNHSTTCRFRNSNSSSTAIIFDNSVCSNSQLRRIKCWSRCRDSWEFDVTGTYCRTILFQNNFSIRCYFESIRRKCFAYCISVRFIISTNNSQNTCRFIIIYRLHKPSNLSLQIRKTLHEFINSAVYSINVVVVVFTRRKCTCRSYQQRSKQCYT